MGEAKRRGTYKQRRAEAVERNSHIAAAKEEIAKAVKERTQYASKLFYNMLAAVGRI